MTNLYFYLLIAFIAGAFMPAQAAINNKLADSVGSPVSAALISFCVGTAALFIYIIVSGTSLGGFARAASAPPVAWTGGLLGAFFVASTAMLVPRLGVALTFGLVVAGQMLVTVIFDHFGILDVPVKSISAPRVAGILLVTVGVILIRRF